MKQKPILVLGDEAGSMATLENLVVDAGHSVITQMIHAMHELPRRAQRPGSIILLLNSASTNSTDILTKICAEFAGVPVMVISRSIKIDSQARSFIGGAQRYMIGYNNDELLKNFREINFREKPSIAKKIRSISGFDLISEQQLLRIDGISISLTQTERNILEILYDNHGEYITMADLHRHLYGGATEPAPRIVQVFLSNFRAKLRKLGVTDCIITSRGLGYRIRGLVEFESETPSKPVSKYQASRRRISRNRT